MSFKDGIKNALGFSMAAIAETPEVSKHVGGKVGQAMRANASVMAGALMVACLVSAAPEAKAQQGLGPIGDAVACGLGGALGANFGKRVGSGHNSVPGAVVGGLIGCKTGQYVGNQAGQPIQRPGYGQPVYGNQPVYHQQQPVYHQRSGVTESPTFNAGSGRPFGEACFAGLSGQVQGGREPSVRESSAFAQHARNLDNATRNYGNALEDQRLMTRTGGQDLNNARVSYMTSAVTVIQVCENLVNNGVNVSAVQGVNSQMILGNLANNLPDGVHGVRNSNAQGMVNFTQLRMGAERALGGSDASSVDPITPTRYRP